MTELEELYLLARSQDPKVAYEAVEELGEREQRDADPATIQLLIDLITSDLTFVDTNVTPYEAAPLRAVHEAAVLAIKQLGAPAIDALIERIATPATDADVLLLDRASGIGRPLFDLARILVTDGDLARSRAAEAVVAQFADELGVDEAIGIYLAIADRERYAPRAMPRVLRRLWPQLRSAEARSAIAGRWTDRDLRMWIEGRLDRDPIAACTLYALLIAGPDDALPILRDSLKSFTASARWMAAESLLVVDPVRTGDLLADDPLLWGWAIDRCAYTQASSLDLRLVIACGRSRDAMEAYIRSYGFQAGNDEVVAILKTLEPSHARAWRDQLVRAAAPRQADTRVRDAVQRVVDAFPL